jgi:hypothetical protein
VLQIAPGPRPGPDADDLLHREDEDLAVPDVAGPGRRLERRDHPGDLVVATNDLELHLGEEVDHVLGTAVVLGVALLPARTP